jgi:hypothetical protein
MDLHAMLDKRHQIDEVVDRVAQKVPDARVTLLRSVFRPGKRSRNEPSTTALSRSSLNAEFASSFATDSERRLPDQEPLGEP